MLDVRELSQSFLFLFLLLKSILKLKSPVASLSKNVFPFFKDFIYLFLDKGEGREKEGEKHQCVVASCMPPTGEASLQPRHVP